MNKERKVIEPNAIVVFEGDVYASKLNELFQHFEGDIIINGDLILEGMHVFIQCDNLYVMGNMPYTNACGTDFYLKGNLYIKGYIDCGKINVNGSVYCEHYIDALEINISEDLYAKGDIDATSYDINVGGELVCKDEVEASEIIVLKKIYVRNKIYADSISVG